MAKRGKAMSEQWRTIGEVCVDSGHIIIGDPCNADDASSEWMNNDLDLNECARNGVRTWQVANAVVAETGLGDGVYEVEARYEDLGEWGKRVAEIRIKFLPHPYFEGRE
jgi:hypothetical protein